MTGEFMCKKETRVAPVIALSDSIATLVTRERGPLSLGRVASGVNSNPSPGRERRRRADPARLSSAEFAQWIPARPYGDPAAVGGAIKVGVVTTPCY